MSGARARRNLARARDVRSGASLRLVLRAVAELRAAAERGEGWPPTARLAGALGVSEVTVNRALRRAEAAGLIVVRRYGRGASLVRYADAPDGSWSTANRRIDVRGLADEVRAP